MIIGDLKKQINYTISNKYILFIQRNYTPAFIIIPVNACCADMIFAVLALASITSEKKIDLDNVKYYAVWQLIKFHHKN